MRKPDRPKASQIFRCAIYTRKSSDEGLAQEFNSLDAQREACEAYVLSQRHAGWIALPDMYDDGGLSGGTMERPGSSGSLPISRLARFRSLSFTRSTG
jgi:site-specific DNA recombinase